jgi:hypothetical protein
MHDEPKHGCAVRGTVVGDRVIRGGPSRRAYDLGVPERKEGLLGGVGGVGGGSGSRERAWGSGGYVHDGAAREAPGHLGQPGKVCRSTRGQWVGVGRDGVSHGLQEAASHDEAEAQSRVTSKAAQGNSRGDMRLTRENRRPGESRESDVCDRLYDGELLLEREAPGERLPFFGRAPARGESRGKCVRIP